MSSADGIVLGIDLGTTNTVCAVVRDGRAILINRDGERIVPSMVAVNEVGDLCVGAIAKSLRVDRPESVVFSSKRLIGRRFETPEVARMSQNVPYAIVPGTRESIAVRFGARQLNVLEIAAEILRYVKKMAQSQLGAPVRRAVVAVPANFSEAQRQATKVAAKLAGLEVLRIINEPTAAALAYGYVDDRDRRIAVYDFGGGTFDVTILDISNQVFRVLSTAGDMFLGGDDMDEAIVANMLDLYRERHGVDLIHHDHALAQFRAAAEELKIVLSGQPVASVRLTGLHPEQTQEFSYSLDRAAFYRLIDPIVRRTIPVCEDALRCAGLDRRDIDEIVLVGGTTRVPRVRELVEAFFGRAPQTSVNPLTAVAVGAAIQGAALAQSLAGTDADSGELGSAVLIDVAPRSLGVRTVGGQVDFLIERNAPVPTEQTRLFTTSHDNQSVVKIEVCEGESSEFGANIKLGELVLGSLPSGPRGEVLIAVTFEINSDGLLSVRAMEMNSGQEAIASLHVLGVSAEAA